VSRLRVSSLIHFHSDGKPLLVVAALASGCLSEISQRMNLSSLKLRPIIGVLDLDSHFEELKTLATKLIKSIQLLPCKKKYRRQIFGIL